MPTGGHCRSGNISRSKVCALALKAPLSLTVETLRLAVRTIASGSAPWTSRRRRFRTTKRARRRTAGANVNAKRTDGCMAHLPTTASTSFLITEREMSFNCISATRWRRRLRRLSVSGLNAGGMGPDRRTPYRGGAGSGHAHHAKHHHGHHHHLRAKSPPHHADNSTPGSTRRTPSTPVHSGQSAPWSGPTTRPGNAPTQAFGSSPKEGGSEGSNLGESVEAWEKRHARPILAVQGLIDISAGAAGVITTIELISVFAAPETLGLSLALGIAVLAVYDIPRGTGQVGAGLAEVTTAAFGSKEDVERVGDGIERFKTSSVYLRMSPSALTGPITSASTGNAPSTGAITRRSLVAFRRASSWA
jgi:hypothetical protein